MFEILQRTAGISLLLGVAPIVAGGFVLQKNKKSGVEMPGTVWVTYGIAVGILDKLRDRLPPNPRPAKGSRPFLCFAVPDKAAHRFLRRSCRHSLHGHGVDRHQCDGWLSGYGYEMSSRADDIRPIDEAPSVGSG